MRVLVCGGRDYDDRELIFKKLDEIDKNRPISCIIHGGARGADSIAGTWARDNKKSYRVFMANWKEHGTSAGSIRNQQMLDEGKPDLVVAFPGGYGTRDMVRRAREAGVEVILPV